MYVQEENALLEKKRTKKNGIRYLSRYGNN